MSRVSEVRHQFAFQIRASKLVVVQDAEASRKGLEATRDDRRKAQRDEERARKKQQRSEEPGVCPPPRPPSPFLDLRYVRRNAGGGRGGGPGAS